MTLDHDITDALGLVSLLLVFVFAYFSALLPIAEDLIARPVPEVQADRARLAARLGAYTKLAVGLGVLIVLVIALLTPLSRRVVAEWTFSGPFQTLRVGLVVVDVLLGALVVATGWLTVRLRARSRELRG